MSPNSIFYCHLYLIFWFFAARENNTSGRKVGGKGRWLRRNYDIRRPPSRHLQTSFLPLAPLEPNCLWANTFLKASELTFFLNHPWRPWWGGTPPNGNFLWLGFLNPSLGWAFRMKRYHPVKYQPWQRKFQLYQSTQEAFVKLISLSHFSLDG